MRNAILVSFSNLTKYIIYALICLRGLSPSILPKMCATNHTEYISQLPLHRGLAELFVKPCDDSACLQHCVLAFIAPATNYIQEKRGIIIGRRRIDKLSQTIGAFKQRFDWSGQYPAYLEQTSQGLNLFATLKLPVVVFRDPHRLRHLFLSYTLPGTNPLNIRSDNLIW